MRKSTKPRAIKVEGQGIKASAEAIDSHVKFFASNEKRILEIFLNYVGFCLLAIWLPAVIMSPVSDLS